MNSKLTPTDKRALGASLDPRCATFLRIPAKRWLNSQLKAASGNLSELGRRTGISRRILSDWVKLL